MEATSTLHAFSLWRTPRWSGLACPEGSCSPRRAWAGAGSRQEPRPWRGARTGAGSLAGPVTPRWTHAGAACSCKSVPHGRGPRGSSSRGTAAAGRAAWWQLVKGCVLVEEPCAAAGERREEQQRWVTWTGPNARFPSPVPRVGRAGQGRNEGVRLRWRRMVGGEAVLVLFLFLTTLLHF